DVDLVTTVTDGQATTALAMAEAAPQDVPFTIYNIDTYVSPGAMIPPSKDGLAGWIPCFPAPGHGWSFARCGEDGRVLELREKTRISEHATVGLYWFDTAARYLSAYHDYYSDAANLEKGEKYVAPLYNHLIAAGARVEISTLAMSDVGMLGTPDQVAGFSANPPPSAKRLSV
ncbi:MAG: dTDP-glucose pyrophosphorylase, partial [Pseudomonadota bacterium]